MGWNLHRGSLFCELRHHAEHGSVETQSVSLCNSRRWWGGRAVLLGNEARVSPSPPAMTSDLLAAKIGQRNAADMTIRFKALKMGATVKMINTMNVFDLLDWISENV
jgi:hypothetical protein